MKKAHGTSKQLPALDERSDGILENRGWSAEAKRRFCPSTLGRHSWTVIATAAELVCTRKASGTAGGFPLPFRTEGRSQFPARRQISWRLGPVETMVMGASMCFSMKST